MTWVVTHADRKRILAQHVQCGHWAEVRFAAYSHRTIYGVNEGECRLPQAPCRTCRRSVRAIDMIARTCYRG